MTTTLVLGDGTSSAYDYGQWLLRGHGGYDHIDAGEVGFDLAGALLSSRRPVLLHGIEQWTGLVLGEHDASARTSPHDIPSELSQRVDELVVARRHLPMDVLTATTAAEWADPALSVTVRRGLNYVNSRLSASSDRVHLLVAGRIVDISGAPVLPR